MTTASVHSAAAIRRLRSIGYVPADPVRERLQQFHAAGVVETRLAHGLGISARTINGIRRGLSRHAHRNIAERVLTLTVEEATIRFGRPTPMVDDVVLGRLLAGRDESIASYDKPAYAHALHQRGWLKTHIADTLHVSGATINKILGTAA